MYDLTGFQRNLLYVTDGLDQPHGLAIKNELEDYYEKEIHHGRLYPNLDTLVEKGLIEKGEKDRRTNQYSTIRRGTREIEARTEGKRRISSIPTSLSDTATSPFPILVTKPETREGDSYFYGRQVSAVHL